MASAAGTIRSIAAAGNRPPRFHEAIITARISSGSGSYWNSFASWSTGFFLARDAVVLSEFCETRRNGGAVNLVHDLVADLTDQLAEVAKMEVAAVFFLQLLLKRRHRDGRFLGKLVAD